MTAEQARQIASNRNNSTKELNEIEDLILLALRRGDDGIQVQLEEQQPKKKVCSTITKETLEQLKCLGYEVEGPVGLLTIDMFFAQWDILKDTMCYRVSW